MRSNLVGIIRSLAAEVRRKMVTEDEPPNARCLVCARVLQKALVKAGIKGALVVQGTFNIDIPNEEAYEDWDENDFDDQDAMEKAKFFPLHYWVEVPGRPRLIVDVTADQFNEELDDDVMDAITVGTYKDYPRYHAVRRLRR